MRRFLLISGDFVKAGGMDRANYALASYLATRGDEVHLVAHRIAADLAVRPNVAFHRVPKLLNSYLVGGRLIHRVGRRWAAQVAAGNGRVVVNGGNCFWGDVNWVHHINALDPPSVDGGLAKRLKNAVARRVFTAEERRGIRMARLIITTCERTGRDIVRHLGVAPEVVRVVHLGIDATLFRPADPEERAETRRALGWDAERPLVAFVGGLSDRRKGFDTLFAAWEELCRRSSWDADLVVVGRGAMLPHWQARAAAAGLAARIHFLGFRRDFPAILRACDAHALPSRYEGYSMVTQEALCCGLPAFITVTAGIAERYPEGLRELVIPDPEDARDLAARLQSWRDQAAAYRTAVAPFAERLRTHTWDRMAEQIVAAIEATG